MRRVTLSVALCVAFVGCRSTYGAPPPRSAPPELRPTTRSPADPGDLGRIAAEESTCRQTLHAQTVAASLQAIDAVTEALGSVCSLQPVDDDPLLWRVWCRSDALFQSGHYLRSSTAAFDCQGTPTESAFECAGRVLAQRLIAPGHTRNVEVVAVGHVDRQRVSMGGAFMREPCTDLQQEFDVPAAQAWQPWTPPEPAVAGQERAPSEPPADTEAEQARRARELDAWNDRLAWCRAAMGASHTLRGLRGGAASALRQVDLAVVGAGPAWLDSQGGCPGGAGRSAGQCAAARRVDVLLRFEAAHRSVDRSCNPPAAVRAQGSAARALYCYEDCAVVRNVGRVRQRYVLTDRTAYTLFGSSRARGGEHWILRRVRGATRRPINLGAVQRILDINEPDS